MALVVLETICVLACGFFLYVLRQWVREGGGRAAQGTAGFVEGRWSGKKAAGKVVSFRTEASSGGRASLKRCERMAHERIARASARWE